MTNADLGSAVGHRVVGLFAHPDDEAFVAGTLLLCSRRGATVTVVCATRGEAGAVRRGSDLAHSTRKLGTLRSEELAASCRTLAAEPPLFFDLPDGQLADLPHGHLATLVRSMLEERRPDVLMTLGADGAYGHRDHIALTRAVGQALVSLAPEHLPRVLYAAFPTGLMRPVWQALRHLPGVIEPGLAADQLGISPHHAHLKVDVHSVRNHKLAAIACHDSQLVAHDPRSFLQRGLVDQLLEEEWFTISHGLGGGGSYGGRDGGGGGSGRDGDSGRDRDGGSGRDRDRDRDRDNEIIAGLGGRS